MAFYMKVHGENPKNTPLKPLFPKNSPETLHRGVLGGGLAGVAPRRLHLEDLGSHVGEKHGAEGVREVLGQIDYPYAM